MSACVDADVHFMEKALCLASSRQGVTSPNPTVGCVIVKDGAIVGEGRHEGAGHPHAEVAALAQAGQEAVGSVLYVTLEPCCHWGRTPPCTDALIAAGIEKVVVAMPDVNPIVSGRGLRTLVEAGIAVTVGTCWQDAARLNLGFIKHITTGRPHITAKWAMTLDGRIATPTRDSKWITCVEARSHARRLRSMHGAVMVGIRTILLDDPVLGTDDGRSVMRFILDSHLKTPLTSMVLSTLAKGEVVILCSDSVDDGPKKALEEKGARVIRTSAEPDGRLSIGPVLERIGELGVNAVLAEGGSQLFGSLFDADAVDSAAVFVAPTIIGGCRSLGPVGGKGRDEMELATKLQSVSIETVGTAYLISGLMPKAIKRLEEVEQLVHRVS